MLKYPKGDAKTQTTNPDLAHSLNIACKSYFSQLLGRKNIRIRRRDVIGQSDFQFSDLVKETVLPVNLAMCIAECKREIYISVIKCLNLLQIIKKLFSVITRDCIQLEVRLLRDSSYRIISLLFVQSTFLNTRD